MGSSAQEIKYPWLCRIFGHKLYSYGDVTECYCNRKGCNYTNKIKWYISSMPPVKKPKPEQLQLDFYKEGINEWEK